VEENIIIHLTASYKKEHLGTLNYTGATTRSLFIKNLLINILKRINNNKVHEFDVYLLDPLYRGFNIVEGNCSKQALSSYKERAIQADILFHFYRPFTRLLRLFPNGNVIVELLTNFYKGNATSFLSLLEKTKIMINNRGEEVNLLIIFDGLSSTFLFNEKELKRIKKETDAKFIYLSHDFYYNIVHPYLKSKVKKYEKNILTMSDFIISASERDKELYLKFYYDEVFDCKTDDDIIVYPNVFPPMNPPFKEEEIRKKLINKRNDEITIVCNVGSNTKREIIQLIINQLHYVAHEIGGVNLKFIGNHFTNYIKNLSWRNGIKVKTIDYLPNRLDFLRELSSAHVGINFAYKTGGTNVKKYDYALASLVVISNALGVKGELLPYEYVYLDTADLYTKIKALINDFTIEEIINMGYKNQAYALELANRGFRSLERKCTEKLNL